MTPFPSEFPADAAGVIISAVKSGDYFSEQPMTAAWNIQGYGMRLGFGKPIFGTAEAPDDISDEQALALLESIQHGTIPMNDPSGAIDKQTIFTIVKWVIRTFALFI